MCPAGPWIHVFSQRHRVHQQFLIHNMLWKYNWRSKETARFNAQRGPGERQNNDRLIKSHSVYMENYRIEFAKQTKFYNCRYRPSATQLTCIFINWPPLKWIWPNMNSSKSSIIRPINEYNFLNMCVRVVYFWKQYGKFRLFVVFYTYFHTVLSPIFHFLVCNNCSRPGRCRWYDI